MAQKDQAIIKLKNLTKYYYKNQKLLFHDINLEIMNEIHAIIGDNSSGKTTLIKMIAGLENLSKGEILILDQTGFYDNINKPKEMIDFKMVYVGQNDSFQNNLTVKQNVILGFEKTRGYFFTNIKESEFKIQELMEKFKIKLNLDKFVRELSFEERKKMALLWALFKNPKILLLDEPTNGLSFHQKSDFWVIFQCLRNNHITTIFTTKDIEFANSVANRISLIKKTKISDTLINNLNVKKDIKKFNKNQWKDLIDYQKPKIENQVPLLYINSFSFDNDKLPSFFNLEFAVRPGEIYGIYDYENLYGELLTGSLVGVIKNSVKRVWFQEKEITFYDSQQFAKLNISWFPTQYDKNAILINENLLTNFLLWNYNKQKYVTKSGIIKKFEIKDKVIEITKKYKILNDDEGLTTLNQLSSGELQKFVLARILEEKPKLLILNNAFTNLDRNSAKIIIKQLVRLIKKGNAILIIDNDPFILELLCQRVAILYRKEFAAKMVGKQVTVNHLINPILWKNYPLHNETFIKTDRMRELPKTKWITMKYEIRRFLAVLAKPFISVKKWISKMIDKINSRVV